MEAEYMVFVIAALIVIVISVAIISINAFFSFGEISPEKLSAYECGFNPFSDARQPFDVKFYVTAIMFIVFDVEVTLLMPFVFFFTTASLLAFITLMYFLMLLTIGFMLEWYLGAMTWV
jgi:NADH:ubiquinone oxidoreductase subunit 3 (subunit A)